MKNEPHVIVRARALAPPRSIGAAVGTRALESAKKVDIATAINVNVDDIDRGRVRTLRSESDVLGVAPAVPMSLIAPVAAAAAPAAGAAMSWGVRAVAADRSAVTGQGVVVAVLDSGIKKDHPAFTGVTIDEMDFTGDGAADVLGHGTHCAGTIFGRDVAGTRIGIAPGITRALIGKVIGNDGGSSPQIVNAIQWAVQNGANVISMSLGIDFPGYQKDLQQQGYPPELATSLALDGYRLNVLLFESLAQYLRKLGAFGSPTLLVAAAGNESRTNVRADFKIAVSPPAVADGFMSVAALGEGPQGLVVAPFSNTGAAIAAPGVDIVSASLDLNNPLTMMSGTSMATPHVAGVAALWAESLKRRGTFNVTQWNTRLFGEAVTTSLAAGFDPADVGAGLVQAPQQ